MDNEIPIDPLPGPAPLRPTDWVHLASGFSQLMWSISIGLLLFVRVLHFTPANIIQLPSYVFAAGLHFFGILTLFRAPALTAAWRRQLWLGLCLSLLLFYLAPFVYWWMRKPDIDHLTVNVFALLFAVIWVLRGINRLAEEFAKAIDDREFIIEAMLCRWSVMSFMAIPLSVYFIYSIYHTGTGTATLSYFIEGAPYLPYAHWIFALFILPLTLTLTIAWKAKHRAMRELINQATPSTTTA
jgi:hypothetical protein